MSFTPSMTGATIADRLTAIQYRLVAMEGTLRMLQLQNLDLLGNNRQIIAAVALDDIARCVDELCWLRDVPDSVLAMPAPTQDERDEAKRTKEGRR